MLDVTPSPAQSGGAAGYRLAALLWSLLHAPLFLALYASAMRDAVQAVPSQFQLALWPTFVAQAALISTLGFVLGVPFSFLRAGIYRYAAPLAMGLVAAFVALDSRIYDAVRFHLNGFFLRVLLQPNALKVTGVPVSHVILFLSAAAAFVVLDALAGAWFIRRFASPRRSWGWALGLLALSFAERVYGNGLTYFGGPAVFAASTVLPLQAPVSMRKAYRGVFGPRETDQFEAEQHDARVPSDLAPEEVRFTRTPDVIVIVAESLPADHLEPRGTPNLWRRTEEEGARFTRHYASSVATNFTIFSLLYGLQPQRLETVVGMGRRSILFPALQRHGYEIRLLTASCLDWMNLRDHGRGGDNLNAFAGVPQSDVRVFCDGGTWARRDDMLFGAARELVTAAPKDAPLFTFLFAFGTHFNYFYPPSSEVYTPVWDGSAGLKATSAPREQIKNRARNAAHALDARIEEFLTFYEARRGRRPIVVFTGDHGEEFREKGHVGHGSAVTREQIHVPLVVFGEGVPRGTFEEPTSHVDVVPTLFTLLGDTHPERLYSDGRRAFDVPPGRFVLSTVGWEPRYAMTGKDLKVMVYAGLAGAAVTDPDDRPLPDGNARLAEHAGEILKAMRGEAEVAPRSAARGLPAAGQ
ncbi:MAG TPA: sulfatase-like hydrolase/transferase [Anaeromyxobacter sp.]|nr:sulfatase-like hydrolase/transferase [Anaeromyxobacter sp.]